MNVPLIAGGWSLLALSCFAGVPSPAAPTDVPTYVALQMMFRAVDTSGNGALDAGEWRAASERLFDLMDTNHDSFLDETELAANDRLRTAYPKLGSVRPGVVGRNEFTAQRDILFRGGDIDGNGYISPVEYEILVLARRAGWNDRNADERINLSELRAILNGAFAILDTDGDGWLSAEETPFLSPQHRAAMDPERTGRISREQLFNGYRWLLGADASNKNRRKPAFG